MRGLRCTSMSKFSLLECKITRFDVTFPPWNSQQNKNEQTESDAAAHVALQRCWRARNFNFLWKAIHYRSLKSFLTCFGNVHHPFKFDFQKLRASLCSFLCHKWLNIHAYCLAYCWYIYSIYVLVLMIFIKFHTILYSIYIYITLQQHPYYNPTLTKSQRIRRINTRLMSTKG